MTCAKAKDVRLGFDLICINSVYLSDNIQKHLFMFCLCCVCAMADGARHSAPVIHSPADHVRCPLPTSTSCFTPRRRHTQLRVRNSILCTSYDTLKLVLSLFETYVK